MASIVTKIGVWLLLAWKPWKRPGWWKGKFTLFGGAGKADASPKVDYPPPTIPWPSGGNSFYRLGGGATSRTTQSDLTVILKLVIGGLTSIVPASSWLFQGYSLSSTSGSVCSHFLEANSWNCGSLCHGYSPVIMQLTSPTWWGIRQLTGYGSGYYL